MGDCDESLARIDTLKAAGAQAMESAPLEIMAAGLKGDFKRVDEALAIPERSVVAPHYRYVVDAYWYAVQGPSRTLPLHSRRPASLDGAERRIPGRLGQRRCLRSCAPTGQGREHGRRRWCRASGKVRRNSGATTGSTQNVLLAEMRSPPGSAAKRFATCRRR
jgi:hypothetical protein